MIAVGDVWAFAIEHTLFGQQLFNTFALRVTTAPPEITETAWMSTNFSNAALGFNGENDILGDLRNLQTAQVAYKNWHVKRVVGDLTNAFVIPIPGLLVGLRAGDCETGNIALSVSRKGLEPGHRSRGRIAVAGLPTTEMAAGKWSTDILVSATALAGDIAGIKQDTLGVVFEMGYYAPEVEGVVDGVPFVRPANFTFCVNAVPKDTVRVQRSRTVGVGS